MIFESTNKLKLDLCSEIQVDEMEFRTKGKQSWFVDIIDTKTRLLFILIMLNQEKRKNSRKCLV